MTQQDHLAQMTNWIAQNQQSVGISPANILMFVDYANRKLWKIFAPKRPTDFRKLYTGFTDGQLLPADWGLYAGTAYYTDGGGTVRAFHLIQPDQRDNQANNYFGQATAAYPAIYFEDMKVRTLPAALAAISIWGFNQPVAMVGAAAATDDGMPQWIANLVHMEAAEAIRELSMDEHKSDETLMRRMKEADEDNARLMPLFERAMRIDARSAVKP